MKHSLESLEKALRHFPLPSEDNSLWLVVDTLIMCMKDYRSLLICVTQEELGTIARIMQVETDKHDLNYSLTFAHGECLVILQTAIITTNK
jgi:hypothetical protein